MSSYYVWIMGSVVRGTTKKILVSQTLGSVSGYLRIVRCIALVFMPCDPSTRVQVGSLYTCTHTYIYLYILGILLLVVRVGYSVGLSRSFNVQLPSLVAFTSVFSKYVGH